MCALLMWSLAAFALARIAAEPDERLSAPSAEAGSGKSLSPDFGGVVQLAAQRASRLAEPKTSPAAPAPCDC